MSFTIVRDPVVGEEVWLATTPSGLRLRVLPRPHLRETAAFFTFSYGSVDVAWNEGGSIVESPAGTAHYLEHKLFEDEELAVFQRFAARGARVNAQTGFARTTYHFQAASHVEENLRDLLRLVGHPHVTDANVEKERGIIAQEVRMYEDSPDQATLFGLLGGLYQSHPVRATVGGTVESIGRITASTLLAAYRAFYRTGNAALAVAGPVDPELVLRLASECELANGAPLPRVDQSDFGPTAERRVERTAVVARPKVLLGLKERRAATDWRARAERSAATMVLLDRLFAGSSETRESLHARGLVDDSLGAGYHGDRTFGFATVGCDTEDPQRAENALREALFGDATFDGAQLERLRRRQLGAFVRGCESVRVLAAHHAGEELEGLPPFAGLQVLESLTPEAVASRKRELVAEENLCVVVCRPN